MRSNAPKPPHQSGNTSFMICMAIVFAFALAGWFAWYSARRLVNHDKVYLRLHDSGFGFISNTAEAVSYLGFNPALIVSLVFGIFVAAWLTRHGASAEARWKRPLT